MTADLIAWLTAQLDDDERRAVLALEAEGQTRYDRSWEVIVQQLHACCDTVPRSGLLVQYLYNADPRRALAEIAAKREIIGEYQRITAESDANAEECAAQMRLGPGWRNDVWAAKQTHLRTRGWELDGELRVVARMLRHLASVYCDRPGYRDEWRPAT